MARKMPIQGVVNARKIITQVVQPGSHDDSFYCQGWTKYMKMNEIDTRH